MKILKIIRYAFILAIYNLIISIIAYSTFLISNYYEFEYQNWTIVQWWLFYSILIVIGVIGLYLAPFYDELLSSVLERILIYIKINKKVYRDKIREKINELEKEYKKIIEGDNNEF